MIGILWSHSLSEEELPHNQMNERNPLDNKAMCWFLHYFLEIWYCEEIVCQTLFIFYDNFFILEWTLEY